MRGYCKLSNFLAFSVQNNPSPTTNVVPPLPVRRGFLVIDFIYQFDRFGETQSLGFFAFSIIEKVAESWMMEFLQAINFQNNFYLN